MIDYLLSSQAPLKGGAFPGTDLPSLIVNVALAAGIIIPVVEQFIGLTTHKHTPTSFDNRQSLNAFLDASHGLLSPTLDGLSTLHLEVQPDKATIATAITVIKGVPTPVQLSQDQSIMAAILSICACAVLALVGTALVFQYSRQATFTSGTSSPAASSDSGGSSPQPSSHDSTPDDSSDEPSGSGSGSRPPPVPIHDIFYNGPISRVDKSVDTGDEKDVGDMDGAPPPPPPPPPSFPTPVEDGDPFKSKASIFKWSSLTLVLSIISLVAKHLFNRFFKGPVTTRQKVSTPTASERITVNDISGNIMTPIPSATAKPVIKPTCTNLLPLVETESLGASLSTLATSTISMRFRRFTKAVVFVVVFTCLILLPFFLHDYLDNHLENIINYFFPTEIWGQSLEKPSDVVEITDSSDESASIEDENTAAAAADLDDDAVAGIDGEDIVAGTDEEDIAADTDQEDVATGIDQDDVATGTGQDVAAGTQEEDIATVTQEEDVAAGTEEDVVASTDDANVATGGDEETDDLMENSIEQETSFNHVVGAGDTTLVVYESASPLAVDLKDILDASEYGIPFHEVFSTLSITCSSDEIPVSRERSESSTNPMFKLPAKLEKQCTVGVNQDIKVLSEHVPDMNIPVAVEQIQTVSKFILEKAATIVVEKVSSTAKVDTTSKENVPIVNINKPSAPVRAETLPIPIKSSVTNTETSSTEPLNPNAASFVPPVPHTPVRQPSRQSSSTSLHYCYSPPSPPRLGLSASMHAPSPPREGSSASIHAPSSPPRQGLSSSIHAPSFLPRQGLSDSIHAPRTPPRKPSIPSPIEHESELPSEPIPIPVVDLSPDRRIRRVIDPRRECNVIVLVGGGSVPA